MTPPRLIRINCNQLGKYLYSPFTRVRVASPRKNQPATDIFRPSRILSCSFTNKTKCLRIQLLKDCLKMDLRALKVGVKIECSGQPAQANNVRRWDGHLKVRHFSVREAWIFDLG